MATAWKVEVLYMPDEGEVDPFQYGWRYVRRVDEHGNETWDQVPLTLIDVLHPEEDDFIVQSDPHDRRTNYLADVLRSRLEVDPTVVVLHDCRVHWGVRSVRAHGPDIAVFTGVRARRPWKTFYRARERARVELVIEVTSLSTVQLDRGVKVEQYEKVGVPFYILVDTIAGQRDVPPRLVGYRLVDGRYQVMAPDEHGRLWLEPAGLWLGVANDEIVLYDEAGRPQGNYAELAVELAAERAARAQADQARVEAVQARIEADQARVEADQARIEADQARAEAEYQAVRERQARADAEQRAAAAEARLRALEEAMRRNGEP